MESGIDKSLTAEFIDAGFCLEPKTKTQQLKPEGGLYGDISIQHYSSYELFNDERLLHQVYGLLINAHYRTTPKDLRYLLDTEAASLYCLSHGLQLLAAAWVMYEGDFDQKLSDEVYLGRRRPSGHLLAQSLTYHCAIQDAATYRYARIVRIAVHPQCQRQGLGSQLLQHIIRSETEVDAIGTSFSATAEGLDFWQQNEFIPVRIGMTRHPASGDHSVMLLHPLSENGQRMTKTARRRMLNALPYHLQEPLAALDCKLVSRLSDTKNVISMELTDDDWQELVLFAYASRTYVEALGPLVKLVTLMQGDAHEGQLSTVQKKLLVEKVLEHRDWNRVVDTFGLEGQKQVLQLLRQAVRLLLNDYATDDQVRHLAWVKFRLTDSIEM